MTPQKHLGTQWTSLACPQEETLLIVAAASIRSIQRRKSCWRSSHGDTTFFRATESVRALNSGLKGNYSSCTVLGGSMVSSPILFLSCRCKSVRDISGNDPFAFASCLDVRTMSILAQHFRTGSWEKVVEVWPCCVHGPHRLELVKILLEHGLDQSLKCFRGSVRCSMQQWGCRSRDSYVFQKWRLKQWTTCFVVWTQVAKYTDSRDSSLKQVDTIRSWVISLRAQDLQLYTSPARRRRESSSQKWCRPHNQERPW